MQTRRCAANESIKQGTTLCFLNDAVLIDGREYALVKSSTTDVMGVAAADSFETPSGDHLVDVIIYGWV